MPVQSNRTTSATPFAVNVNSPDPVNPGGPLFSTK